jgi:hypothetical protein
VDDVVAVPALLPAVALVAAVLLAELPASSLRKLGPEPAIGVAKFRGLGSVLLSLPL